LPVRKTCAQDRNPLTRILDRAEADPFIVCPELVMLGV